MTEDKNIKLATQVILEVLRKHDLAGYFVIQGRKLVEVRYRFPTWSCFEQEEHPEGSVLNFRTRKGGSGPRRSEEDIDDSCNIARCFAEELSKAAVSSIGTWKELQDKLGAEGTYDEFRGPPPPWDLK